jgi:hypothetical protein
VDPEHWKENEELQHVKQAGGNLEVINDSAEKGVRPEQDISCSINKDAERKQHLLQVFSDHRKSFLHKKEIKKKLNENFL